MTTTTSATKKIAALAVGAALAATLAPNAAAQAAPSPPDHSLDPASVTHHGPGQVGPDAALTRTLKADVARILEQGAPGVHVQVATGHGTVDVRGGYGDKQKQTPVPYDGHFRIASFTKTFVSATVLKLVGQGRLSLDDTVEKWLPGQVRGNGNDGRKITVRQLLGQTSGLPDYTQKLRWLAFESFFDHRYETVTPKEQLALAMSQKPNFAPGTSWGYSNTNYLLAGQILEKVAGKPWQEVVREKIVEPLGLTHTSFPYGSPRIPGPHARGYNRFVLESSSLENPVFGEEHDVTELNSTWGGAAGEMISTAEDGNTFLRALLGGRVLKPAQLAAMKRTVPVDDAFAAGWPGARYGLGLMHVPTPEGGYWEHGGDIQGFMTRNGVTPDGKRSVIVSLNTDTPVPAAGVTPVEHDIAIEAIDHALYPGA
jgi:D-alanyl-D-alanine carboxypeptidase